jgi:hypothetical protein
VRTTLDIDDDVLQAARERARRDGKTIGAVVSELARRSLTSPVPRAQAGARQVREPKAVHGFRPFPSRGGIVTNERIDQLREDDAY